MKNNVFMAVILIFIFSTFCFGQIVEEVEVKWWLVPVFAVDKSGNPINDLQEADIQLWMNNQPIKTFKFYKRSFSVDEKEKVKKVESKPEPVIEKEKVVILLFDKAVSRKGVIERSKVIAKKIILTADKTTQFIIMTIEPFAELTYSGEGSDNKEELIQLVDELLARKRNKRHSSGLEIAADVGGGKYSAEEMRWFGRLANKYLHRKSMSFFNSFETLYYILNSIGKRKFVYLFSEGISNSMIKKTPINFKSARDGIPLYNSLMKRIGGYLNRSGAVLFLINPVGADISSNSRISGEDSLRILAKESGGKYLEGVSDEIVKKIENMHRAYYEISFPDLPGAKSAAREITIKSKRKGVSIHTLRSLEKRKHYPGMNNYEREMLVLNLITQNPLFKNWMPARNARIDKVKKGKKSIVYKVNIPDDYLQQKIDLYKVWIIDNREVKKIEHESLVPRKNKIKIEFKGKEHADPDSTYFVLVNGKKNFALVRGMIPVDEESGEDPGEIKEGKGIKSEELQKILAGAAGYCEKLKKSAFHFICKEKIYEVRRPLSSLGNKVPSVRDSDLGNKVVTVLDNMRGNVRPRINSYVYSYRLIKKGADIKEEREWISSANNVKVDRDNVVKPTVFFSEKAIFAPTTILARERQGKHNFRFLRFDTVNGRATAVIEAIPKEKEETAAVYGTLWIDTEDFSVLKTSADPRSIRGYRELKRLAKKLRAKLHLSLVTEFNEIRGGIRFPTRVSLLEKYKGGRYILWRGGAAGWERNQTAFTYSDYQFFNVQVDVTVHKSEKIR